MKSPLLLAAFCAAIILPGPAPAQTVISNLGQSAAYNAPIEPPNEKEAAFLTGPDLTRITQLSLHVQQGGTLAFTGTFSVSLFLADNTTNAPTGGALASDSLGFSFPLAGPSNTVLVFDATDLANINPFTLSPGTKYSLVFSDCTEINLGLLTTFSPTYVLNGGFTTLGTLSSSDNGSSWGSYGGGTNLIYALGAVAVPEPSTFALLAGLATLGLAGWIRRRRRA